MSRPEANVLVVEDDPLWNSSLSTMYSSALSPYMVPKIQAAFTADEALAALRTQRFDVLSCDINLSGGEKNSESARSAADGRKVLREAADKGRVSGVVIPTAIAHDLLLILAIPDRTDEARLTLNAWLDEYFGLGRYLRLDKSPAVSPAATTAIWAEKYAAQFVALTQAWPSVKAPYTVNQAGNEALPRISIWSTGKGRNLRYDVSDPDDARFLLELCVLARLGQGMPVVMAAQIYGHNRPQIKVDQLTRRLTRSGLDPRRVYDRSRGFGWALSGDVTLRGFATVDRHDADPDRISLETSPPQLTDDLLEQVGEAPDPQTITRLHAAVARLPEDERAAIAAVFFNGLPHAEAAELLNCRVEHIRQLTASAIGRLREDIGKIGK